MILDGLLQFSAAQPMANAVGSYDSVNIIDLGINNGIPGSANGGGARDIGIGDDPAMKLMVSIATAFAGAGATISVQVQTAPDNGAGQPGTWTVAETGPAVTVANFNAGARIFEGDMPRPAPGAPLPRYLKLTYVIAGAATTAGSLNAYLVLDRADRPLGPTGALSGYPENFSVPN